MYVGYSGFVPLMQNRLGMTFHEATHAALNEFSAKTSSSLDPPVATGQCGNNISSLNDEDDISCHIGCSTQPPRRC